VGHELLRLPCSHTYCSPCMEEYVVRKLRLARPPLPMHEQQGRSASTMTPLPSRRSANLAVASCRCPVCSLRIHDKAILAMLSSAQTRHKITRVEHVDLKRVLKRAEGDAKSTSDDDRRAEHDEQQMPAPPVSAQAERQFMQWARMHHIKPCPNCSAPIEKRGGCRNMRCYACQHRFRWDQVPLSCPCAGYHYIKCYPFVKRCEHMKLKDVPTLQRASYIAQKTIVSLPALAILTPAALAIAPFLGISLCYNSWKKSARARRRRQFVQHRVNSRRLEAGAARWRDEVLASSCSRTGNHQWVLGWCPGCGTMDPSPLPPQSCPPPSAPSASSTSTAVDQCGPCSELWALNDDTDLASAIQERPSPLVPRSSSWPRYSPPHPLGPAWSIGELMSEATQTRAGRRGGSPSAAL
jgi:hypothetical protein